MPGDGPVKGGAFDEIQPQRILPETLEALVCIFPPSFSDDRKADLREAFSVMTEGQAKEHQITLLRIVNEELRRGLH